MWAGSSNVGLSNSPEKKLWQKKMAMSAATAATTSRGWRSGETMNSLIVALRRPTAGLPPQLVDRGVQSRVGKRDIFEPAPKRVVPPDGGPIDADRRVNGRLDVLGPDVAVLRPPKVGDVGPARV